MNCANKDDNQAKCPCTYPGCPKKGMCCECLRFHLSNNEVPACFFSPEGEKSYDRSIDNFIRDYQQRKQR